jgi:hypothetical protein
VPKQVVVLVHGMNTVGPWMEKVERILQQDEDIEVWHIKNDFVDLLSFLCPLGICRKSAIEQILNKLRVIIDNNKDKDISMIAHSNGTYAISEILMKDTTIRLHKLLLCGSIVRRSFNWDLFRGRVNHILNEYSVRDIWPVLAQLATIGYGASGTYGFGGGVKERKHSIGHSDYFTDEFIKTYWLSFFSEKEEFKTVQNPSAEDERSPGYFYFLHKPIALVFALAASLLGYAYYQYNMPCHKKWLDSDEYGNCFNATTKDNPWYPHLVEGRIDMLGRELYRADWRQSPGNWCSYSEMTRPNFDKMNRRAVAELDGRLINQRSFQNSSEDEVVQATWVIKDGEICWPN